MRRRLLFILSLFLLNTFNLRSQESDSIQSFSIGQKTIYSFIIQDSPARLFTMRQFNENYLSGYLLFNHLMNNSFSPKLNYLIQAVAGFVVFIPLTHEEGHRSILISKNIGSVSEPFFFSKRGGYIDGVTDASLVSLRDKDFPVFARLYTAGLESDYMLTHREEAMFSFGKASFKDLAVEYLMRKFMLMQYYLIGFFKYDVDGAEEKNELNRDIVGNDVYGIVRQLHRPTMPFQRYTRYSDLTSDEISYLKKMGYRSFLNLLNPNIIGISNIRVSKYLSLNLGMGHTMCPFGDFTDENLWLKIKGKLMIDTYFRQYQNKNHTFLAGGFGIKDYPLTNRFVSSIDIHFWDQPEKLSFTDDKAKFGGGVEWIGKYFFNTKEKYRRKGISLDFGLTYKTAGFLPEEIRMQKHFGMRLGTSIALDRSARQHIIH
jgi:hypothetical protein